MQTIDARHATNEVIQFNYQGGENPGELRTVYVLGYTGRQAAVEAYCFKRAKPRRFTRSLMKNVVKVGQVDVNVETLPSGYTPDALVRGYVNDGKKAYHDATRNVVVVFSEPKLSHTITGRELLMRGPFGGLKLTNTVLVVYNTSGVAIRTTSHPKTLDIINAVKGLE